MIFWSYRLNWDGYMGMKIVVKDGFDSGSGNPRSSALPSTILGEWSVWGGSSITFWSSAAANDPSSISLGERTGVHDAIDTAADGAKMTGNGSPTSLGGDLEVDGRDAPSMKDQSWFKSRALFECELQLRTGRTMARMRATKRRYMYRIVIVATKHGEGSWSSARILTQIIDNAKVYFLCSGLSRILPNASRNAVCRAWTDGLYANFMNNHRTFLWPSVVWCSSTRLRYICANNWEPSWKNSFSIPSCKSTPFDYRNYSARAISITIKIEWDFFQGQTQFGAYVVSKSVSSISEKLIHPSSESEPGRYSLSEPLQSTPPVYSQSELESERTALGTCDLSFSEYLMDLQSFSHVDSMRGKPGSSCLSGCCFPVLSSRFRDCEECPSLFFFIMTLKTWKIGVYNYLWPIWRLHKCSRV